MLVANGANINATNWSGQTPLRLAQGHFYSGTFVRYPETAQLFRELGADPVGGRPVELRLDEVHGRQQNGAEMIATSLLWRHDARPRTTRTWTMLSAVGLVLIGRRFDRQGGRR